MKRALFTLSLFLWIGLLGSQAQTTTVDSLNQLLAQADTDTAQARLHDELAWAYLYDEPETARNHALTALALFKRIGDTRGQGITHVTVGNTYLIVQAYDSATLHYNQALPHFEALDAWKNIGTCYNNLAIIAGNQGQLAEAEAAHQKGLEYRTLAKDTADMVGSMINLGAIWLNGNREDEALEIMLDGLLLAEAIDQQEYAAILQSNIGSIYINRQEGERAQRYIRPAVQFFEETNSLYRLAMAYNNLSQIFLQVQQPDSAIHYLGRSLSINDFDQYTRAYSLQYMASAYARAQQPQTAKSYYEQALQLQQELDMGMEMVGTKLALGRLLHEAGDYAQANTMLRQTLSACDTTEGTLREAAEANRLLLEGRLRQQNQIPLLTWLSDYARLRDTIYNREQLEAITAMETRYQSQQKESENQLLRQESLLKGAQLQRQRAFLLTALLGAALLGLVVFLLYRRGQERQRSNRLLREQNQKIEALHQELSHRVKNNLAFVSSLMRLQSRRLESEEARQAVKEGETRIEAMSLLHRKLYLQDNSAVDISNYLHELCTYLQHTFPAASEVPSIEVESDQIWMNGEVAMRLGLIVNELVTNSFKYAFAQQPNPQIAIQLSTTDSDGYQLLYRDNGRGLPTQLEVDRKGSLGLKLLHALSQQLNGQMEQYNDAGACFRLHFAPTKIAV